MPNLLLNAQKEIHLLVANKMLMLVAWKVSGNPLLIQDYQSRLPVLPLVLEDEVQTEITTRPGENGLAGVLEKKIDPVQCSANFILDFLAELFDLRYKKRLINSYISAYNCYVEGEPVGQHNQVCALIMGFFTKKPLQLRYIFTRDIQVVLDFDKNKWGNSNSLSDRDLTFKLLILLALTSASRACTIHCLDIGFMA